MRRREHQARYRILSFFITARLAAQDTREAFTEVVLQQLAALLGRSLLTVLPESTREAFLPDLGRHIATPDHNRQLRAAFVTAARWLRRWRSMPRRTGRSACPAWRRTG